MPAPRGNQNAAKGKRWQKALEKALARFSKDGTVEDGLAQIATCVVELAAAGDKDAWREIGDRIDGKPQVSVELRDNREPRDWTDAELDAIIASYAGRGGSDQVGAHASTPEPDSVH